MAVDENGGDDVVAGLGVGQQIVEQVIVAGALPEMMVRINDPVSATMLATVSGVDPRCSASRSCLRSRTALRPSGLVGSKARSDSVSRPSERLLRLDEPIRMKRSSMITSLA